MNILRSQTGTQTGKMNWQRMCPFDTQTEIPAKVRQLKQAKTITNKVMAISNRKGKDNLVAQDEPATLPGPLKGEEELKDYSKDEDEDIIDNMPDSHPEPSPTANS
jgi:hypothetical protein